MEIEPPYRGFGGKDYLRKMYGCVFMDLKRVLNYQSKSVVFLLDSKTIRKRFVKKFSTFMPVYSGVAYKEGYTFFIEIDDEHSLYTAGDIRKNFPKPLLITGLGLYGEEIIKEYRIYEKIKGLDSAPIILYGSPKESKLERISKFIDYFFDISEPENINEFYKIINTIVTQYY